MVDNFPFVFHTTASWSNGHWDVVLMKMSQQLFYPWTMKREKEREKDIHIGQELKDSDNDNIFFLIVCYFKMSSWFYRDSFSSISGNCHDYLGCFTFSIVWISEFSWSSTCCYPRLKGPVLITNRFYRVESLTLCLTSFEFKVDLLLDKQPLKAREHRTI